MSSKRTFLEVIVGLGAEYNTSTFERLVVFDLAFVTQRLGDTRQERLNIEPITLWALSHHDNRKSMSKKSSVIEDHLIAGGGVSEGSTLFEPTTSNCK